VYTFPRNKIRHASIEQKVEQVQQVLEIEQLACYSPFVTKISLRPVQQKLLRLLAENIDEPLTIRELKQRLELSSTSLVAYHINRLEKKGYLKRSRTDSRDYQIVGDGPERQVTYLNLYGLAQCGPDGSILDDEPIDRIPVPSRLLPFPASDGFLVKAKGDSMVPRICPGDILIVRKAQEVESGDIAVCINEGQAIVKKIQKEISNRPILVSLNSKYIPFSAADDFRIVGKVTGFIGFAN
jgi:repressor LexA